MIVVQDTLLGFKYKSAIYKAVPISQGLGVILEIDIGKGYGLAEGAGQRGYRLFRGHAMWRDRHDFRASDIPEMQRRGDKFDAIAARFPRTSWYVSGALEHRVDAKLAKRIADAMREACPHCTVVNVPLSDGAIVPNYINESHSGGPRSSMCAWSWDGHTPKNRSQVKGKQVQFKNGVYVATWGSEYNGRESDTDNTPRPQRTDWADVNYIKKMVSWS